jgi:hypothetical protein
MFLKYFFINNAIIKYNVRYVDFLLILLIQNRFDFISFEAISIVQFAKKRN